MYGVTNLFQCQMLHQVIYPMFKCGWKLALPFPEDKSSGQERKKGWEGRMVGQRAGGGGGGGHTGMQRVRGNE